jgi:hypothetical protein
LASDFFLLAGFGMCFMAQLRGQIVEVEDAQQVVNTASAPILAMNLSGCYRRAFGYLFGQCFQDFEIFFFGKQVILVTFIVGFYTLGDHHIAFVVDDGFQFFGR